MAREDRSKEIGRPAENLRGTLRIRDLGDEAHLEIEQRVDWTVALAVLKELKAPNSPPTRTEHARRMRRPASPGAPARNQKREAA